MTSEAPVDYAAVRDGGAGLIDLSSRGRMVVSGSEAAQFLNGLVTNDMNTLALHSWMPAAFLNVQGRLLAVVRILHREDGFHIDTEAATRATVLKLLERFTLAGDFRVNDVTRDTALLSVQGRNASEIVRATLGDTASATAHQRVENATFSDGGSVTIIRATHTGEDGFDLFVNANQVEEMRESLTEHGARNLSEQTQETLRIEAGIPRFGFDMDETTILSETNLEDAVSFTKGCYVGQEIIIRIKHRGHVAKKMAGISFDTNTPLDKDAKILSSDGQEIGRVTSSAFSPRLNRAVALAYVKFDYLAPGTKVRISNGEVPIAGETAELPFIRGSWYA